MLLHQIVWWVMNDTFHPHLNNRCAINVFVWYFNDTLCANIYTIFMIPINFQKCLGGGGGGGYGMISLKSCFKITMEELS